MRKNDVDIGMKVVWHGYSRSRGETSGAKRDRNAVVTGKSTFKVKIRLDEDNDEFHVPYSTIQPR